MPVPTTMADLSTSAASNSPAGGDTATVGAGPDDYLRAHAAIIKTHSESTAEHGATGAVVGTTNTQTLTNKTLTAPVINGTVTTTGLTLPAFTAGGAINGTTIPTSKTLLTTDDVGTGSSNVPTVSSIVGTQTIWIPAGAMVSRTTNGAASGTVQTTTHKVMIKTLDFDTAADEHAQFVIRMPKNWDEGTLTFTPVWSHAATTTNFGVAWFLQAGALANDDALDTAFGTAVGSVDTGGTTNDVYIGPASSAMTVAGSPGAEEFVVFQIYRDVSDAGDTLAVDARLHGVTINYTTNALNDN